MQSTDASLLLNVAYTKVIAHEPGRPTTYDPALARRVLDAVAAGKSLRAACREPGMPAPSTVREWIKADRDGLSAKYQRASDLGVEAIFDEMMDIADNVTGDIRRDRLRIATLQWIVSKRLRSYSRSVGGLTQGDLIQDLLDYCRDNAPTQ